MSTQYHSNLDPNLSNLPYNSSLMFSSIVYLVSDGFSFTKLDSGGVDRNLTLVFAVFSCGKCSPWVG